MVGLLNVCDLRRSNMRKDPVGTLECNLDIKIFLTFSICYFL